MLQESLTRDHGKLNVWDLYSLSESKRIPIRPGDADFFLHLLFSNSSKKVEFVEMNTVVNWVVLRLWGPITDDAIYSASEFETPRLYTEFKLWSYSLRRALPVKEERDEFVARLHELGGPGEDFRHACKALRVRRLGRS
jgi:hypothetical protein